MKQPMEKIKKLKIAVFTQVFPALSETFILNQITGLMDLGHDVHIFAIRRPAERKVHPAVEQYGLLSRCRYLHTIPSQKWRYRIKTLGFTACYLFRSPARVIRALRKLFRERPDNPYLLLYVLFAFLDGAYDILHFHFGTTGRAGAFLKEIGIPGKLIVSFHGHDVNRITEERGRTFYRSLFTMGDLFLANTHFTKQQVIRMGCPAEKIKVLPVGFDIHQIPFRPHPRQSGEPVRILTVGRLVEKKGICYSISAVCELIRRGNHLMYTIVGEGPERERLESLVKDNHMEDRIIFAGEKTQQEIVKYYEDAHFFVLASVTASDGDREGQGLVIQEAQAAGLPVVSTYHNGIPEGVIEGETAFLVPEKDVQGLADRLQQLIDDPSLCRQMGLAGRAFVEKRYDRQMLCKQLTCLYETAISGAGKS